jgi:hypothetical protein
MSAPVAMVLACALADKFHAVACFDRRTSEYVVCLSVVRSWMLGHSISPSLVRDWIPAKTV